MAAVRGASRRTIEAAIMRSGRRGSRVGIVLLALAAIFFGGNFARVWLTSHQIQQNAVQLQARIDATNALNAQLQSQLTYYSSKEYIIPAARALGMARPGDTLMLVKREPAMIRTVRVQVQPPDAPESLFIRLLRSIFQ